jgi:hypothetical protein
MTQRTLFDISFAHSGRRDVVAGFCGGRISSDGGLPLLRQVEKRLNLADKLAVCAREWRNPDRVEHPLPQLFAQRTFAIACGYEDGNDHLTLRDDPLFQLCAARPDKQLASPATISRFENRSIGRRELLEMQGVFVQNFLNAHKRPPKEIILDFDSSDIELHGDQEGKFFHGYYDHHCYLPLYIYCGDHLLCAWLRPANIDNAKGSLIALKLLVNAIRKRWPKTRIVIRADSGFTRDWLLHWCENNDVGYILGLAKNSRLKKFSADMLADAQAEYEANGVKGRVIGEFEYATLNSWSRERRVIARIEHTARQANPRYVVTDLKGEAAWLYEEVYCARGEMENRIKEQQKQMFGSRTSCSDFLANQLRVTLAAAAYTLVKEMRRLALKGTELENAEAATLRLKLLKVGAQIETSARRFVLKLSSYFPRQDLFKLAARRLALDTT